MMSARLLKAEDASGAHDVAKSRTGFYGWIDRAYTAMLRFSMRNRIAVAVLAILVIFSSVPLYKVVRQDYLPSDVDESEFDVSVNAREGTSFAAMEDVMRSVEKDLIATPGVQIVLASAGGGFNGSVIRQHGDEHLRIGCCFAGRFGNPGAQ